MPSVTNPKEWKKKLTSFGIPDDRVGELVSNVNDVDMTELYNAWHEFQEIFAAMPKDLIAHWYSVLNNQKWADIIKYLLSNWNVQDPVSQDIWVCYATQLGRILQMDFAKAEADRDEDVNYNSQVVQATPPLFNNDDDDDHPITQNVTASRQKPVVATLPHRSKYEIYNVDQLIVKLEELISTFDEEHFQKMEDDFLNNMIDLHLSQPSHLTRKLLCLLQDYAVMTNDLSVYNKLLNGGILPGATTLNRAILVGSVLIDVLLSQITNFETSNLMCALFSTLPEDSMNNLISRFKPKIPLQDIAPYVLTSSQPIRVRQNLVTGKLQYEIPHSLSLKFFNEHLTHFGRLYCQPLRLQQAARKFPNANNPKMEMGAVIELLCQRFDFIVHHFGDPKSEEVSQQCDELIFVSQLLLEQITDQRLLETLLHVTVIRDDLLGFQALAQKVKPTVTTLNIAILRGANPDIINFILAKGIVVNRDTLVCALFSTLSPGIIDRLIRDGAKLYTNQAELLQFSSQDLGIRQRLTTTFLVNPNQDPTLALEFFWRSLAHLQTLYCMPTSLQDAAQKYLEIAPPTFAAGAMNGMQQDDDGESVSMSFSTSTASPRTSGRESSAADHPNAFFENASSSSATSASPRIPIRRNALDDYSSSFFGDVSSSSATSATSTQSAPASISIIADELFAQDLELAIQRSLDQS